jgi:hypothetical protein
MPAATKLTVSLSNLSAMIEIEAFLYSFCSSRAVVKPITPDPTIPIFILSTSTRFTARITTKSTFYNALTHERLQTFLCGREKINEI